MRFETDLSTKWYSLHGFLGFGLRGNPLSGKRGGSFKVAIKLHVFHLSMEACAWSRPLPVALHDHLVTSILWQCRRTRMPRTVRTLTPLPVAKLHGVLMQRERRKVRLQSRGCFCTHTSSFAYVSTRSGVNGSEWLASRSDYLFTS